MPPLGYGSSGRLTGFNADQKKRSRPTVTFLSQWAGKSFPHWGTNAPTIGSAEQSGHSLSFCDQLGRSGLDLGLSVRVVLNALDDGGLAVLHGDGE